MPTVRSQIMAGSKLLHKIAQTGMTEISNNMINQIMRNWDALPDKKKYNATNDVEPTGMRKYETAHLEGLSGISNVALKEAANEIGLKKVKLSEYKKLPSSVRSRVKKQASLYVGSVIADYTTGLFFLFDNLSRETDSRIKIEDEMKLHSDDWVTGYHLQTGSQMQSATIVNESRVAVFKSPEGEELIEAYKFVNHNPVTSICQELNGQYISENDPRFFEFVPPLHFNCKSYINPVLNLGTKEVEKLNPSKTAMKSKKF